MKIAIKITIFVFGVLLLLSTPTVTRALSCSYDSEPYFDNNIIKEDKIFMLCTLNSTNTSYCYTSVNESGVVLQSNPEPILVDKIGITNEYFETRGGRVNAYYTNRNLLVHHNYTVKVECSYGNGTTEEAVFPVIPVYKELNTIAYRAVWTKENMSYIFGGLLFILILGILIYAIIIPYL